MNTKTKYSLLSASIMVLGAVAAPAAYAACLGAADTNNCLSDFLPPSCTGSAVTDVIICPVGAVCVMNGGGGDDFLAALPGGNDIACGGNGNDFVALGSGNDIADGNNGNDGISAGGGDDVVFGGFVASADLLDGGAGTDTLDGGPGSPDACINGEATASCDFDL